MLTAISTIHTSMDSLSRFLPPRIEGYKGIALTTLQIMVILTSYSNELKSTTPYSKFAHSMENKQQKQKSSLQVPSRIGMLVIYTPALMVSFYLSNYLDQFSNSINLAGNLCVLHFLKRVLEVLFLHKYSGSTPLAVASMIGTFYALTAWLMGSVGSFGTSSTTLQTVGSALFVIGSLGNLYHHYLLACLRKTPSKKEKDDDDDDDDNKKKVYMAPRGGWFEYVAAPHYFFELVAWLGMAVAAHHINAYLVVGSCTSYLAARAKLQNEWNRSQFSSQEWPPSRKHLIPGIF